MISDEDVEGIENVLGLLVFGGYTIISPCGTDITPLIKEEYGIE